MINLLTFPLKRKYHGIVFFYRLMTTPQDKPLMLRHLIQNIEMIGQKFPGIQEVTSQNIQMTFLLGMSAVIV